ncbi:MAG: hypothetical protein ACK48F_10275 [Chryseotalea sp.]|jgi:hypothetical protein
MKIKSCYFILWLLLTATSCFEDSQLKQDQQNFFVRYLGSDGNQTAVDFELLEDGNLVILYNSETENGEKDFYLTKFSQDGIEIWTQNLGNPSRAEVAKDVIEIPGNAGGYGFAIGFDVVSSPTSNAMAVLITSPDGNKAKEAVAAFTGFDDRLRSVTYNPSDGGLIVTGNTRIVTQTGSRIQSVISRLRPIADSNFGFYAQNEPWGRVDFGGGAEEDVIALFVNNNVTGNDAFHWFMTTNEAGNGTNDFNFYTAALDNAGLVSNGTILPNETADDTNDYLNFVLKEPDSPTPNLYSLIGTNTIGNSSKVQVIKIDFGNIVSNPSAPQNRRLINIPGNYKGIGLSKIPGGYWVLAEKQVETVGELVANIGLVKVNDLFEPIDNVRDLQSEFNVNPIKILSNANQKVFVLSTAALGNQQKVQIIKLNRQGQFSE